MYENSCQRWCFIFRNDADLLCDFFIPTLLLFSLFVRWIIYRSVRKTTERSISRSHVTASQHDTSILNFMSNVGLSWLSSPQATFDQQKDQERTFSYWNRNWLSLWIRHNPRLATKCSYLTNRKFQALFMFYLPHVDSGAGFLTVGLFADFKLSESNYQTLDLNFLSITPYISTFTA